MWIADQERETEVDLRRTAVTTPREGRSQCECPDFCPVQHDNDN